MKKYILTLYVIVLAFTILFNNQVFANDHVLDTTVEPFFTALKSGDAETIKLYVGGVLYQNITEAFERNNDYGTFIRKRYDGAVFHPSVIEEDDNKMVVSVDVEFPGKGISAFELLVKKDKTDTWRIIDQYSP